MTASHKHQQPQHNNQKKYHSFGFTLVELLIVIVIISILATLTVFGANKIIRDAHDSSRESTATIITESLEEYYEKYGEYPSVKSLVNTVDANTGTAVAKKLGLNPDDLKMPRMPTSATNALTAGPTPHDDYITYVASSEDATDTCQTVIDGGCDQFTLQYIKESDGETVTIYSRHGERMSPPTEPTLPTEIADNFNRTGETLGSTSVGDLSWNELVGDWKTNGSQPKLASKSPSANPLAVIDAAAANVDVRADIGPDDAVYFRVKDSNNWWRVREQKNTQSSTYYTSEPYTYYTYSYSPGPWESSFVFCENGHLYPSTGTYYDGDEHGYSTSKSVHYGIGSGGCGHAFDDPRFDNCGKGETYCGFQIIYYKRTISQTSTPHTGYQSVAHTTYTDYYGLVLEKMINGNISKVWTQNDSTSQPSMARVVASDSSISVYNSTSGSALKNVIDNFNTSETKHGIGRAVVRKSGSGIDNFSLVRQ